MAGRKKLPTKLKRLKGTARKDRLPKNEPKPREVKDYIEPPDYLGVYGKQKWDEIFPLLKTTGVLTESDLSSFTELCKNYENMMVAYDSMDKNIANYLKDKQANNIPFYRMYRDGMDEYKKWLVEFGMTPSSRGKVEAVEVSNKSDEEVKGEQLLSLVR